MLVHRGGAGQQRTYHFFNSLHQPTYLRSLRSGFKSRLNGLLALLMRTSGERRGQQQQQQLQYYRQYHHQRNHHYHRYNQEEDGEETWSRGPSKVEGTVV